MPAGGSGPSTSPTAVARWDRWDPGGADATAAWGRRGRLVRGLVDDMSTGRSIDPTVSNLWVTNHSFS